MSNDKGWESAMSRDFDARVRDLHESPLELADIKGRATSIRRRRRAAVVGAVAAATVAVIVPTAAYVGLPATDDGRPDPAQTPSVTETTDAAPQLGPELDASDLPVGDAPKVAWIEGTTLHTPDGDVPLPDGSLGNLAPMDDGWIGVDYGTEPYTLVRVDASGATTELGWTWDTGTATSLDQRWTLYAVDGVLRLHDNATGEDQIIRGDTGMEVQPVGVAEVLDPEVDTEPQVTAFYNLMTDEGPRFANWKSGNEWTFFDHVAAADPDDPEVPYFLSYTAVGPTGATGRMTELTDSGSCSDLISAAHEQPLAGTCDYQLAAFSPAGNHVIGVPAYRDGRADGVLAILSTEPSDEIGGPNDPIRFPFREPLVHYEIDQDGPTPEFWSTVWEDTQHVLAVTFTPGNGAEGTWQILRIGLDGTVENAVDPVEGDDMAVPFALP